jgi:LacI family transcriptional regulator
VFTGRIGTPRRWEEMQTELQAWLRGLPRPVGLMACNDVRARHVLEACRSLGLRVPHDVAVIGVDNDEMVCELTDPPLSSVDQSARRIGYEAAALLDRLMQRKPPTANRVVVPPIGVVARASTDTLATNDAEVVRTLQALKAAPGRRPRIADLATAAGISRSSLEQRFRAAVGRTIHEEHVRLRVAATRKLIVETTLPLKAVAVRTGFPSLQYMTTFVRRHTGLTPARLRAVERSR